MKDYNFGNYLFRLRKANHLSQKELGKMLGVSDKAVSRWENGSSKPRAALLVKLSAILDTTVDALMTGGKKSVLARNSAVAISLHEGTFEN